MFAFDLAINPAGTIAYLADNDNGIVKFTSIASERGGFPTIPFHSPMPKDPSLPKPSARARPA